MTQNLPASASVVAPREGGRLHAPAAARNAGSLVALLQAHAPTSGKALEIASGTGQHIVEFASALHDMMWHPTDIAEDRRASIDSYARAAAVDNIAAAEHLDATQAGWGATHAGCDLIVLVNLLHLISARAAQILITEAAEALRANGTLILYGPFKRDGRLTSAGDRRFDTELRAADPAIGYKDNRDMDRWLTAAGLAVTSRDMPANNLAFIARKPAK